MEFKNEFEVRAPLDAVWATMLDVERVAPCVPGAKVIGRSGDDAYDVGIRVKLGPITQEYRGRVEILERDPERHEATMTAKAREARGQGMADATVRMRLDENGGTTHGTIWTDMALSGRAASMGTGMIGKVAGRITDEFAQNLAGMLAAAGASDAAAAAGAPESGAPAATSGAAPADSPRAAPAASGPWPAPDSSDAAALEVSSLLRGVLADRLSPEVLVAAALGLAIGLLAGRRSRR